MNAVLTPSAHPVLRAAMYARNSHDPTDRVAESVNDQVVKCRTHAEEKGWLIEHEYREPDTSGVALANRPHPLRMLRDAKARLFDVLLIVDTDRLSRSQELAPLITRIKAYRVRVIGVNDRFDSDSPTARLQAGMSGMMSEEYIAKISARVHDSAARRTQTGKSLGFLPYGYRKTREFHPTAKDADGRPLVVSKNLEIDPEQAAIVLEIFQRYANGESAVSIARDLNARKVLSPGARWTNRTQRRRDGKWLASTLQTDPKRASGILCNEIYRGKLIWNRSVWIKDIDSGRRKRFDRPESEWIPKDRPDLAIVPDRLWHLVRERFERGTNVRGRAISEGIAASRKRVGGRHPRHWLGGIITCGHCGANLIGDSRDDYVCPTYSFGGPSGCNFDLRFRRSHIDEAVFAVLAKELLSDAAVARATREIKASLLERVKEEAAAARNADRGADLKRLDEQERQLRGLTLHPEALKAALNALDRERSEIEERATASRLAPVRRAEKLIAQLPAIVDSHRELISAGVKSIADPIKVAAAREAIRKLLVGERIVLKPNDDHTGVVGEVHFVTLGDHALDIAGFKRKTA